MRCAIYCRLSREDENKVDESESIQNQRLLLHQYADDHGWTVCAEYIDDDRSGADSERPGFNALLRDAEAGRFDILLCKTQSRFTRDLEISEHYLHRRFSEWGVRFISVVDGVDTGRRDNLKTRQLGGLINEWYIADLSDNVRAVFDAKRRRGDFIGSFAPYGYRKSKTLKGRLEPDPEAAAVVREIFRLAGEGYTCAEIARQLTARAIPNPTVYKLTKGEKYFNGHSANRSRKKAFRRNLSATCPGSTDNTQSGGNKIAQTVQGAKHIFSARVSTVHSGAAHAQSPACVIDRDTTSTEDTVTELIVNPHTPYFVDTPASIRSASQIEIAMPIMNCRDSTDKGAPADTCAVKPACSSEWSRSTVSRILRNECYLGAVVQGKREKVSYKSKRLRERKRCDWIVVYGVNEPIVTREEFERAQKYRRK